VASAASLAEYLGGIPNKFSRRKPRPSHSQPGHIRCTKRALLWFPLAGDCNPIFLGPHERSRRNHGRPNTTSLHKSCIPLRTQPHKRMKLVGGGNALCRKTSALTVFSKGVFTNIPYQQFTKAMWLMSSLMVSILSWNSAAVKTKLGLRTLNYQDSQCFLISHGKFLLIQCQISLLFRIY
jgi:hypothetical protein